VFAPLLELADGIRRATFPLPTPPGHVHAYLLRDRDGWMLVDTGLGVPELDQRLESVVGALDAPVTRIVITHMHPDHVGGGEWAAAVTGAVVLQGELDYAQCERVWGNPAWPERVADWFGANGTPDAITDDLRERGPLFASYIRFARDPEPLREGDRVAGWEVLELPGHADGHLCLYRDGLLIAGDHLLPTISPAIGLYPESRPDPLGDYLASLERTVALAPAIAFPGHGDPVADPVARARELIVHHEERLDAAAAALGADGRTGYELSLVLFGGELDAVGRRFAVAETLAHLERLVALGRARRAGDGRAISYTEP
jgi:glyoxylase-like metal-dependent hydrolase (beta-lactamase superfamily II)